MALTPMAAGFGVGHPLSARCCELHLETSQVSPSPQFFVCRNRDIARYSDFRTRFITPTGLWSASACHGLNVEFSHCSFISGVLLFVDFTVTRANRMKGESFSLQFT